MLVSWVFVTAASASRASPERRLKSLLVEFDGDIELPPERLYLSSRPELSNTPPVRCGTRSALVKRKPSAQRIIDRQVVGNAHARHVDRCGHVYGHWGGLTGFFHLGGIEINTRRYLGAPYRPFRSIRAFH